MIKEIFSIVIMQSSGGFTQKKLKSIRKIFQNKKRLELILNCRLKGPDNNGLLKIVLIEC